MGRVKKILTRSLALLALVAVLAGCEITAKTATPNPVTVDDQLTFTIEVLFEELPSPPFPIPNFPEPVIFIEDELPANVKFVSASPECEFIAAENTVRCAVENPTDTVGATASVQIVVTPTECGTFTNTATIPDPFSIPLEQQQAVMEQLSVEEQVALEQLSTEDLITAQQIDEESVDFTVVGCEQPEPQPQPEPSGGAAPITQDTEKESEAGEIDQSFEVS